MCVAQSLSAQSEAAGSANEKARVLLNAGFPNSLLTSSEMDFFYTAAGFCTVLEILEMPFLRQCLSGNTGTDFLSVA